MTTHARVGQAAVDQAVKSIFDRHVGRGDPQAAQIGQDPGEVLAYLRKHAHRLPAGLRADDLPDVAVLLLDQWWQARRRELWWLDEVVRLGASKAEFAAAFGKRNPTQAFRDWRDRLHQLLDDTGSGRPDEQAARADRRPADAGEAGWLLENLLEYRAIAEVLVNDLYPVVDDDTAELILEVRRDLKSRSFGVEHLVLLQAAVEALAECEVQVPRRRGDEQQEGTCDLQGQLEWSAAQVRARELVDQVVTRFALLQQRRGRAVV